MHSWPEDTVIELQKRGILRVEDGNHGEYRPRKDEFSNSGVAFIRAADMEQGRISFDRASKINDVARSRITKGIGLPGDVIISHKGTVGKIAVAPLDAPEFVCSPQTTFWRTMNERLLDRNYLYAFMRSRTFFQRFLQRSGETDMAPYVSLTSQRQIRIPLPPIEVQRGIASTICCFDEKIELNRRMSETLEAMARAIFRDWFVEFGPTRAKTERREPYLADDLWELFPDLLDDNGIPEGWEEKPLDKVAKFLNGLALQKFPASDPVESLPVIKIAELRNGITGKSNRASRDVPADYIVKDGDFLFSWSGSLIAKFWTEGEGALNQHLFKVSSAKYPSWFFSQWVHYHLNEFRAIAESKATTMGHIQRAHLTAAVTNCPPAQSLEKLGEVIEPMVAQTISNELENRRLAQTRDLLLPKLMSGEISVKRAEKAAGGVA